MSMSAKPNQLKLFIAASGLLGLLLRLVLLETALDEKGLLISGHWADVGVWLLTAAVIGMIFLFVGRQKEAKEAALPGCIGALIAACGFLLSGDSAVTTVRLAAAEPVLKILAAAALVAVAYCRFRGKTPSFLLHGTVCLYLALRMVCRYQLWSADPQLQHYAFYLGAHVAVMLGCYQQTALDAGSGDYRSLWRWCLAATYLCLTALPGSEDPFFLLCCGIWMLSNLTGGKGD